MRIHIALLIVAIPLAGCRGSEPAPEAAPEPAPVRVESQAWPTLFQDSAVLVAREVFIEGPEGLREHVALRVEPEVHEYVVRTVPEGLVQELSFKSGQQGQVLRVYLDKLEIAAELRVHVLEHPGDWPLSVVARGEVFYQVPGQPEQRGEQLRLGEAPAR